MLNLFSVFCTFWLKLVNLTSTGTKMSNQITLSFDFCPAELKKLLQIMIRIKILYFVTG